MTKEAWARTSAGVVAAAVLWAIWPPLGGALERREGPLEAIWGLPRMFTIITNLLVGLIFARIAWRGTDSVSPLVIGGIMLGIVLVGVVFNLLLIMLPHQTIWYANGDYIHHVAAPTGCVVARVTAPAAPTRVRSPSIWYAHRGAQQK